MSNFLTATPIERSSSLTWSQFPDLQTGGTAAQYCIGTAKVKKGSHILLDRMKYMLRGRGRHTLNTIDAIHIWHT